MAAGRERVALAAFLGGSVFAGGNAVAVRFSNRELDPLWGASLRFALAAVALLAVMAALRLPLPRGRALTGALLYGSLQFAAAFALAYYALVELHAGFGQTVLALVPLVTLLLAMLHGQQRLHRAAVAGALLALAGVVVMSRAPLDEGLPVLSILATLGSSLCFAEAAVLVRRFPPLHPVTINAVGMATGAVLLFAGSLAARETLELPGRGETWAALAYLVVAGSMIVFVLYIVVLRFWSAPRAAYSFVLIPIVTLLLSAWLDNEPVGLSLLLGGALVLGGVYVGALRTAEEP